MQCDVIQGNPVSDCTHVFCISVKIVFYLFDGFVIHLMDMEFKTPAKRCAIVIFKMVNDC